MILNKLRALLIINATKSNCGIGSGGFKPGNLCAKGGKGARLDFPKRKGNKWVLSNGKPLPPHVPKRIPPAWTKVKINLDPQAKLIVTGVDSKGRPQRVYSASHTMNQAAKKFAKIKELRTKDASLTKEIEKDLRNPATKESATVLYLIKHTGIRPGSEKDTKAVKQAYGATTLQARHVSKDGTRLNFVGKKGVDLSIKVTDPNLIKILRQRKNSRNPNEKLFDVSDRELRLYTQSKDGGGFNPKDFRTAKGTQLAFDLVSKMKSPKTEKEYKDYVKEVATAVSIELGNTLTVVLQSYIDPTVFAGWRNLK